MTFIEDKLKELYDEREEVVKEKNLVIAELDNELSMVNRVIEVLEGVNKMDVTELEKVTHISKATSSRHKATRSTDKASRPKKKARAKGSSVQKLILDAVKEGPKRRKELLKLGSHETSAHRAIKRLTEKNVLDSYTQDNEQYVQLKQRKRARAA